FYGDKLRVKVQRALDRFIDAMDAGWLDLDLRDEALPRRQRLGQSQLEIAHIFTAQRAGKPGDSGFTHLGFLRKLADAGMRGKIKIIKYLGCDLAPGVAQLVVELGDLRHHVYLVTHGRLLGYSMLAVRSTSARVLPILSVMIHECLKIPIIVFKL